MRWNYNDEYRDEFGKGPHRDILIVPHGTKVTPVAGGPPEITSRVPLFNDDGTPQTSGGNFVMSDVDWVITNKDIVKEQFKYSYSLNPAENITFSSASSAMVQFTIRNNKEYNPDTDTWELDIPNLQYYSYYDKNNNLIIGELEGNYIIKVYTYINGDSSTLLCLGMFRVEEDKAVDNGYNRQITAYDFMATFRDMDIFNWYKRLFDGINKLDNDYIDATNKTGEEQKKPDDYDAEVNWVRKPSKKLYPNRDGRWTIGEALQDLINNLAAFDMIVWSDDGKTAMVGGTSTNPSAVGRDYGEGCGYSGYGMPIVIDPNILDKNAKPYTPIEPGQDEYEEYGYMKILELEFYPDPSLIKSGSLSMGKFLEDIGILAGRYPMIRPDKLIEDQTADYFDPRTVTDPKQTRYNTYEKCILTFKSLPTSKDDKTDAGIPKLQPEQQLSNHEIVKGFQHALFDVKDVMIVKIGMQDGEKIEYKILNKTQRKQAETNDLQTFSFSNNLFCSYLVDSSDDEEIKKLLPEYKKIKEKLFGKEKDNHNMTSGALFEDGYYNIKNRSYVPYTLTTYGDPVRDVGDRILINFEDKITGEKTQMYTYILERELSGIQKMMDTYKANGQITSPVFSNYQTGSTYQSGFGMNIQMLGYKHSYGKGSGSSQGTVIGVSPSDLVSYLRNVGIRLLDEPLTASAKFVQNTKKCVELKWEDPGDIETWEPTPADWKGTIVIRKEDSAPKHRWDGEEIVRTTTSNKDAYKDTAYKDEDIQLGKIYYYGFFPYYKKREQDGHNINFFRFTKVIKVETGVNAEAPEITNIMAGTTDSSVTIFYTIPALKDNSYSSVKVYAKIGEVPKCDETDDIVEDIDATINGISLENLEFETEYFFCIQSITNDGLKLSSNVESITTGNPVPAEYRQYIDLINGCNGEGLDFFWKNYSVTGASRLTAIDNPANFSYVRPTGNWSSDEVIVVSANRSNGLVASTIITLNINKQQNNTYKVLVSGYDIAINENRYAYSFQYSYYTARDNSLVASSDYVNQYVLDNYWKMRIFDYDFSTLLGALQFLTKNIRNANIYADGVLWSKANNAN